MKVAVILHLYYERLSTELIERVRHLDPAIDVFVTGRNPLSDTVRGQLAGLRNHVEILDMEGIGFDVGPFLRVLRILRARNYDIFCKLHTKRGDAAFGVRWRDACLAGVVRSRRQVDRIIDSFGAQANLTIVGAADLFLSARVNMLNNSRNVTALASVCFPGRELPADWGFFAGTMFWGRVPSFAPFLRIEEGGGTLPSGLGRRDGHPAHALERLFGLAAWPGSNTVGLVGGRPGVRRTSIRVRPPSPIRKGILEVLAGLGRPKRRPLTSHESDFVQQINPLLFYLRHGRDWDFDPHPFFNDRWYLQNHGELPEKTPLQHFLGVNAEWGSPSPMFDVYDYVHRHVWLPRLRVNPLSHLLRRGSVPPNRRGEARRK